MLRVSNDSESALFVGELYIGEHYGYCVKGKKIKNLANPTKC